MIRRWLGQIGFRLWVWAVVGEFTNILKKAAIAAGGFDAFVKAMKEAEDEEKDNDKPGSP